MNIFALHESPEVSAEMACDKHVVKMILESAQLLCTVHRVLDGTEYNDLTKNGRKIKRWRLDNDIKENLLYKACLLYTSPSPRDRQKSRMPSSA